MPILTLKRGLSDIPHRRATFEQAMRHVGPTATPVRKGEHHRLIYDRFTIRQLGDYVEGLVSGR
jgi:hypothetical protein